MVRMTTKEAILYILTTTNESKYWLAIHKLKVAPIMINNYIRAEKPCKMSKKTAKKFAEIFNIEISDIYNPTKLPEVSNE